MYISEYTEIVVVTIASLVAANAWIILMTTILRDYFPNQVFPALITAVIMTIIACGLLWLLFERNNNKIVIEKDNTHPKTVAIPPTKRQ